MSQVSLELEHAIAFSGLVPLSVQVHPNNKDFVYLSGCSVVIEDLNDPHSQVFLRGHDDKTACLAVSPSGKYLCSGQIGTNSDVIVWDFQTQKLKYRFCEHDHGIVAVSFSLDERLLITLGDTVDRRIFVWDMSNGFIVTQTPYVGEITALLCGGREKDVKRRDTKNYVFATCGPQDVHLWTVDPFEGTCTQKRFQMGSNVRRFQALAMSPDEMYLYAGSDSGDISVFSMQHQILLTVFPVCSGGIRSIAAGRQTVYVGGGDGTITVYVGEGKEMTDRRRIEVMGSVNSLSVDAAQTHFLVGTAAGIIHRMRIPDLTRLTLCESHTKPVARIAFPPTQSDTCASVSEDGTVRVWDLSEYKVLARGQPRIAGHVIVQPHCLANVGESILTGWSDGSVRAFDGLTGQDLWSVHGAHRDAVNEITVGHRLSFFLTGGENGEIRMWSTRTRELRHDLKEHRSRVTGVIILPDDEHALTAARDKLILTWDLTVGRRLSQYGHRTLGAINSIALHRNRTQFVSGGNDKRLVFWDIRQQSPVHMLEQAHADDVNSVDYANLDDTLLVTGGQDQIVKLWDVRTNQVLATCPGHSEPVSDVAFSPDDKQVLSCSNDGGIFVWNLFKV